VQRVGHREQRHRQGCTDRDHADRRKARPNAVGPLAGRHPGERPRICAAVTRDSAAAVDYRRSAISHTGVKVHTMTYGTISRTDTA